MRASEGQHPLFTSILCPVDFSPHSRVALRFALTVARRSRGRLAALFVNDPLLVAAAAAAYDTRALTQTSDRELQQFVHRAIGASPKGIADLTCQVTIGDPASEVKKATQLRGADLIVLGTQGLSGTSKILFGSTTESVLRTASVPVLAVPPLGRQPTARGAWPRGRLMAAIDLGTQAAADARRAAIVAEWFGTDLSLVHVVPPTQAPRWLSARLRAHDQERLKHARERLSRIGQTVGASLDVTCHVLLGHTAEQLPVHAADEGADLVVVTLRTRSGLLGAPQGSITYRVLCGTGVPVLALPPKWQPREVVPR